MKGQVFSEIVQARITKECLGSLRKLSEEEGLSVSCYIRRLIIEKVKECSK